MTPTAGPLLCSTCGGRGYFFANGLEYDCGVCLAGEAYAAPYDHRLRARPFDCFAVGFAVGGLFVLALWTLAVFA